MDKALIELDTKTPLKGPRDTYYAKEVVDDTNYHVIKAIAGAEKHHEQRSCALEDFPSKIPDRLRLIKFQHWVVFRRAHDQSILHLERHSCPVLSCRRRFNDQATLLSHIFNCERLVSGIYWCPYCQQKETFIEPITRTAGSLRASRGCIWRIAYDFISDLGLGAHYKASSLLTRINFKKGQMKISKGRLKFKPRQKRRRSTAELMAVEVSRSEMSGPQPYKLLSSHTFKDEQMKMPRLQQLLARESYEHESNLTIAELMGGDIPRAELGSPELRRPTSCQRTRSSTLAIPEPDCEPCKRESVGLEPWISPTLLGRRNVSELAGHEMSSELESPTYTTQSTRSASSVSSSYQLMDLDQATERSSILSESPVTPDDGDYPFRCVPYDPISPCSSLDRNYHSHRSGRSSVSPISDGHSPYAHEFHLKPIIEHSSQEYILGSDPVIGVFGGENISTQVCELQMKHMSDYSSFNPAPWTSDSPPSPEHLLEQRHVDISDLESLSPASLITALVDALHKMCDISIEKICQPNTSASAFSFVSRMPNAESMMEIGLMALRKVFLGDLPTTPIEIYSLLQLAYAATLVVPHDNPMLLFDDLFVDVLDWAEVIESTEERALFIEVAQYIWLPKVSYAASECYLGYRSMDRLSINGQNNRATSPCWVSNELMPINNVNDQSILLAETEAYPSQLAENTTLAASLEKLRGGKAIYLSARYFDVLEYAGLLASAHGALLRGEQRCAYTCTESDSMTVSVIKENIIEALLMEMGLEALHPIVAITEKSLNQGAFRNLRELELKLLYDGMLASGSQEIFEAFLDAVTRHCDRTRFIVGQDPMPRSSFHTQIIDTIRHDCQTRRTKADQQSDKAKWITPSKAASSNIHTYSPIEVHHHRLSAQSEFNSAPSDISLTEASISHSSGTRPKSYLTLDTSSSTIKTPIQKHSRLQPASGSPAKIVAFLPSPDGDIISPDSSPGDQSPDGFQSSLQCTRCGQVFIGKKRYLNSNLSRHMKAVHPNKPQELICSFQGCKTSFTRSDNLLTHHRKIHGIAT